MTLNAPGACKKVEYINVRGYAATEIAVYYHQTPGVIFHVDSSVHGSKCAFNARTGSAHSEDNFGWYDNRNKQFRCTADPASTTQHWFGGYA